MKHLPIAGLLLLSLAACSRSPDSPEAAPAPAKDTATATAPADADLATTSPADPRADSPARLDGFGGARLGASIADVRSGFGAPLQVMNLDATGKPLPDDDNDDECYYLRPQGADEPRLMIEGRKLVRYEVFSTGIVAPGGGKVGMTLGELQLLYPERADLGPDKYDDNTQHLRVRPAQEGAGIIDFEVAPDGKVNGWRVGQTPQVDYVEGCL
ncbi:hypothetical protein [Stenotrophomonas sp.]|uniref:hypothetical protein n=1 Tax=Stenotrophomonas sp. TaxID=69392 RepID=UPI0028AF79BF|nr:hypothetical protein [Stenotrophomonas sp.]